MSIVYRIQNKEGIGPYYCNACNSEKIEIGDMIAQHNNNNNKPILWTEPGQFCAFLSLSDLHKWFSDKEITMLKIYNYFIYKVKNVMIVDEDYNQIAFEKYSDWSKKDQEQLN